MCEEDQAHVRDYLKRLDKIKRLIKSGNEADWSQDHEHVVQMIWEQVKDI